LTLLLLLGLTGSADAITYDGTPVLRFRVDRPANDFVSGEVELIGVRVHHCGGGYTDVSVNDVFDPVAGGQFGIPAGDHCQITFAWGSDLEVQGPGYVVVYSESTTAVPLDEAIDPVYLSPYTVVSGSMSGYGPWLVVTID
jgi:hypothetical protein